MIYSADGSLQVFKNNIEKRIRSLPEIDGLSKETVLSSWMAKFDQIFRGDDDPRKRPQRQSAATSEMILTKEQLYDMFQNILAIKKYEHQILYNAMQVRQTQLCSRVHCLSRYRTAYSSRMFIMTPPLTYLQKWRQVL